MHQTKQNISSQSLLRNPSTFKSSFQFVCFQSRRYKGYILYQGISSAHTIFVDLAKFLMGIARLNCYWMITDYHLIEATWGKWKAVTFRLQCSMSTSTPITLSKYEADIGK